MPILDNEVPGVVLDEPKLPGVVLDKPSASADELFMPTKEGFLSRVFRQIAQQQSGEIQGAGKALSSENPLLNVSPEFLRKTSPGLSLLPKPVAEGVAQGGANVLSSLTAPANLRPMALAPLAPELIAGYFAGTGAKSGGETLGQASVEAQTGDTKEASQHTLEGLASLLQTLPALGLARPPATTSGVPPQVAETRTLYPEGRTLYPPEQPLLLTEGQRQFNEGQQIPASAEVPRGEANVPVAAQTAVSEERGPTVGEVAPKTAEQPRGQFHLESPYLLESKDLGFNPEAKIEGQQLQNRLRNKVTPGEYVGLQEAGLEEFLKEKRTPKEVAEWVRERGPRVETKVLAAVQSGPELIEYSNLHHELETLGYKVNERGQLTRSGSDFVIERGNPNVPPKVWEAVDKYHELETNIRAKKTQQEESATARYTMVNPKPLEKMPGAVDLLVRIPLKKDVGENLGRVTKLSQLEEGIKYSSSHYPTEGKNLLAHVRGYMETTPDGKKVFHIFEVQSDWAQHVRQVNEQLKQTKHPQDDPLLKHYERLALKAAIEHARKNGADAIAISDAETAMLTEGHDRSGLTPDQLMTYEVGPEEAEGFSPKTGNYYVYWKEPFEGSHPYIPRGERVVRPGGAMSHGGEVANIRKFSSQQEAYDFADKLIQKIGPQITQEKGMRLHYDKTLPKIAEELTGEKGQTVGFGEHRNAVELPEQIRESTEEVLNQKIPRQDLIFRNPDGTPKTTITARLYPIAKAKPEFTLFGSDKPQPQPKIQNAKGIRSNEGPLPQAKEQTRKAEVQPEGSQNLRSEDIQQPAPGQPESVGQRAALVRREAGPLATMEGGPPMGPPRTPRDYGYGNEAGGEGGGGRTPREPSPPLEETSLGERLRGLYNRARNVTVPHTQAVSPKAAEALIQFGSAAEEGGTARARSQMTDVLGEHWKDTPANRQFQEKAGAVIIEDMARAVGKTTLGKEWTPLKNEADYIAALGSKDIQDTIKRFKTMVQAPAEAAHAQLGGKLAPVGDVTGAFLNLKAILSEGDIIDPNTFKPKGDPEAMLRRPSRFSRKRNWSAEGYETNLRTLGERMFKANYAEAAKQRMYATYAEEGLARKLRQGEHTVEGEIERTLQRKGVPSGDPQRGRTYVERWAFRKDVVPELDQSLQLAPNVKDMPTVGDVVTRLQTAFMVDAVTHMGNLASAIYAQPKPSLWQNLPVARELNTIYRVTKGMARLVKDSPKTQRDLADIAEVNVRKAKDLTSADDPAWKKLWKTTIGGSGGVMNFFDRASRLSLKELHDELLESGAKDDVLEREAFYARAGQYNKRLQSRFRQMARDYGVAPFVTAGRAMNENALKSATFDPGVKGDRTLQTKLIAYQAGSLVAYVAAAVPAANKAISGNAMGYPGTPVGAVSWKDDEGNLHTFDPLKFFMLRRMVLGLGAVERGVRRGKPASEIANDALTDMYKGAIHPYVGPIVNVATMLSPIGKDVGGFHEAEQPGRISSRAKEAAKTLNPTVEAALTSKEKGKSVLDPYSRAAGFATPKVTVAEQAQDLAKRMLPETPRSDRIDIAQKVKEANKPTSIADQRKRTDYAVQKEAERRQDVQEGLSKESQDFLTKHNLIIPEAHNFRSIERKVSATYTAEEKAFLLEAMKKEYETAVSNLRSQKDFDAANEKAKQFRLQRQIDAAQRRAEASLVQKREKGGLKK